MERARRAVLLRALEIIGDRESFAGSIGVRPELLDIWLADGKTIPEWAFLRAVDIVQAEAVAAVVVARWATATWTVRTTAVRVSNRERVRVAISQDYIGRRLTVRTPVRDRRRRPRCSWPACGTTVRQWHAGVSGERRATSSS